jgi:hypothetical protein
MPKTLPLVQPDLKPFVIHPYYVWDGVLNSDLIKTLVKYSKEFIERWAATPQEK